MANSPSLKKRIAKSLVFLYDRSMEQWKPFPGYDNRYEISNLGSVKTLLSTNRYHNNSIISQSLTPNGYKSVRLYDGQNKKHKRISVARSVLLAFLGPCPDGMECAHLNGIKTDNRIENLKWISHKENMSHQYVHGTRISRENGNHHSSKLTPKQVLALLEEYEKLSLRPNGQRSGVFSLRKKYGIHGSTLHRIINKKNSINCRAQQT